MSFFNDAGAGGEITLQAGGDISTANLLLSESRSFFRDAGVGGAITLDAGGDIQTDEINSESSSFQGDGGDGGW
ncbi:MAG: hypothetical protein F6K47_41370 [Symploca sp. SIO2E6]|nr:hypothetical protein [Symploca sp. SIO2E6]